ncbi:MAG: AAA family ATPase, partial [Actinomycetota bacterium]|nr:AAA family ATPase [Actinomycetota bacterium]
MSSVLPRRGPLVGRAGELVRLAEFVGLEGDESSAGVLLSGDAGVGKTRLLAALRDRAENAKWRILVGHCLDLGNSAPPYLPFSEALGRLAAQEPVVADTLVAARPAVGRLLPGAHRRRPDEGSAEAWTTDRSDLFESVHAALEQLARSAPVLMLIEDIHWADRSTREMLSFLFTRSFAADVTVVTTYRSDDLHRRHPLRAVAAEWARLSAVSRLHLDPLEPQDIRVLVQTLHATRLPEKRVRDIIDRSEGNAFFTEELVAAADRGDKALPVDLAGLLLVRLDQLDEQTRQVVRAAAVAGRQVSHRLLERVIGIDSADLDRGLRAAVDGNVLVAVGSNGYAFRHALLAEAIYDDLLPGEKVRLHGAYTTALGSTIDGPAAELARHARAAHDMVTATRFSVLAGDEAMVLGGPDEAARHYETALELLSDPATHSEVAGRGDDRVDPVALSVRASGALSAAGHVLRAVALVQDQLHQLPTDAEPQQRAELLRALAAAAAFADVGIDVLQVTQEALSLVPAEPPTRLRAQLVNAHAWAYADRLRDEDASRWLAEAHHLAETLGLPDIATDASTTMARIQERAGDPGSSRLLLERTIETARATGEFAGELRGLYNLAGLAYESGRLCEAYDVYRETASRADEHGRPWAPY